MRLAVLPFLAVSAIAVGACGDDTESSARGGTSTTTAETASAERSAAGEAHATKEAIERAIETYESGDRVAAEEQVAEAYVSHFEKVEHELEERDAELTESLEERISGDLREAVKAGDDAKVQQLAHEIEEDLERAQELLGGSEGTAEQAGTPLEEAGKTKAAIREALKTYTKDGDAAKAHEQVAEAYVSHFEKVEHELEERDAELMESLEHRIAGDLRQAIKAKDDAKVKALSTSIVADLEKAEAALR